MRKQTLKNVVFAVLIFCMFVGLMPQIAADYNTAQAAAADIYYDCKKANDGSNISAATATKRSAFAALTCDVVADRNTSITSGAWAYNSFSATAADSSPSEEGEPLFRFSNNSVSILYYFLPRLLGLRRYLWDNKQVGALPLHLFAGLTDNADHRGGLQTRRSQDLH